MSETNGEAPGKNLAREIAEGFDHISALNERVREKQKSVDLATATRDSYVFGLKERIRAEGFPEDVKLSTYALMFTDMARPLAEIFADIDALSQIDARLKEASAQAISWLGIGSETVGHSFRDGAIKENRYDLNIGLLPYDASLRVTSNGAHIPIDKGFRVQIFNNLDKPLFWDKDLGNLYHFVGSPAQVPNSELELNVKPSGPIGFNKNFKIVELPPALIGNKEVEAVFKRYELESYPQVIEALNCLTDTLFES